MMGEWNIGMMDKKNKIFKPIIPSFHYSNIPAGLIFHHSNLPYSNCFPQEVGKG